MSEINPANNGGAREAVNDFVIKFANTNGSGSASANHMFAKAIFRMGVPISPKNIFPSNIQGMPTWYEIRVSEKGYLGRREGIDIMVAINPQTMADDVQQVLPGGYIIYDSTMPLDLRLIRSDVNYIGLPLTETCRREYDDPKQRQLFKNVIYVGALSALLNIDFVVLKDLVADQFKNKQRLISPNIHALELGYKFAHKHFQCPLATRVEKRKLTAQNILTTGNEATGLGAVYGGATVAAWYPITPSTSVVDSFDKYTRRLRIDPGSGKKNFAIAQAEDELSAIGMVIGASWNGARAFTATSGPGISLMSEFLGLAYFAEVPVVLHNVQRAGPSTGMPTRTQQSDVLACAYASHGDTKHVLLFPASPKECFDFAAAAHDIAERLQTPVIVLSDLDLGMNDHMSAPLEWDDQQRYDRGKVLDAEALKQGEKFGRYLDVDDDGICYRTYPGTHPTKGAFFTRGTSRDPYAIYTEDPGLYKDNMERLLKKFETAKRYLPQPQSFQAPLEARVGVIFFGTSTNSTLESLDILGEEGTAIDGLRIRAFPFNEAVDHFIRNHDQIFVIEQNRDAQLRTLLINENQADQNKLISLLNFDGLPITARYICDQIRRHLPVATGVVSPNRAQRRELLS